MKLWPFALLSGESEKNKLFLPSHFNNIICSEKEMIGPTPSVYKINSEMFTESKGWSAVQNFQYRGVLVIWIIAGCGPTTGI